MLGRNGHWRRALLRWLMVLLITAAIVWLWFWQKQVEKTARDNDVPPPAHVTKAMVAAKTRKDDAQWMHDLKPDWIPYIYTSSRPPERGYKLRPPAYRGRESLTYLTFIIDNYEHLPEFVAFVHAGPDQWHNDLLGPRTSELLKNVRLDTVRKKGYLNLRCKHDPGCPVGVNPFSPTETDIKGKDIRAYFADVYMELFNVPPSRIPKQIGNVCCGQFVVSRDRIRDRPREDYVRMRRWAMDTKITDSFGVGWVFEKVWHIIFGMPPEYCPEIDECKCDLLGWCGPIPETCEALSIPVDPQASTHDAVIRNHEEI